jgi:hypothetical protein
MGPVLQVAEVLDESGLLVVFVDGEVVKVEG